MLKLFVYLILTALFIQTTHSLDKCTSTSATLFDGYLDTYLYYASFDRTQNSYLKITNPFAAISPLNSITVAFWAKFPVSSADGLYQSGTLLDCSDTAMIKITNGSISYTVYQPATISNFQNGSITTSYTNTQLQSWQSYAFSVSSSTQYMYFNGVQTNSKLTFSALGTSSSVCTVGNSLALNNPINAYMRHLYFSKLGWTTTTNVTNVMHHQYLPNDSNMLSYFMFSRNSGLNDTYFFNTSRQIISNSVYIQYTNEPEFVCYCTDSYPNFMKVNSSYTLNTFNLTNLSSYSLDNTGFTFTFQIYSYQPSTWNGDILVFSISNYASLYITNNSNTLRLDLFNTTNSVNASAQILFKDYRFRYNAWNLYNIALSKTTATLQVDGILFNQIAHTVILPTNASFFTLGQSSTYSYLLNTLTLKNAKTSAGQTILNYTFTENYMNAANLTRLVSSGTMLFDQSNSMCTSSSTQLTNYWTGFGCTDNRLFPYFDGNKTTGYLQTQIASSLSTMTIEVWIRDINRGNTSTQVIFENSIDGTNPSIQMGIITGTTTSQSRSLFCSPLKTSNPTSTITLSSQTTYNVWGHFSCVSDASLTQVTAYYYNSNTQSTATGSLSNTVFMNQQSTVTTSLGSRVDGTSRFVGFIREFRIWSQARSSYNLQIQRYQAQSPSTAYLINYFLLSDQLNPLSLIDAQKKATYFTEQVILSPIVQWNVDKDLVICQVGLYYDGQCCSAFSITNANFQFVYSKNTITAYVDPSSLNNAGLYPSLKANYSVLSVGNNFTYLSGTTTLNYLTYISSLFNQNSLQYLNVSAYFINPLVYNITLQAIIYSDYSPTTYVTRTQTLKLTCPIVFLNILPNYVTDNTQIVSMNSTDQSPEIYATTYMQCYNTVTKQAVTNTQTSLVWSLNTTTKFSNLFTVASDNMSLSSTTNKSAYITSSNQYIAITSKLTYNRTYTQSNSIQIYYAPIQINSKTSSTLNYNVLSGSLMYIDLSTSSSSNSAYSLAYSVTCPSTIFANTSQQNSLCVFPTTPVGVFMLDTTLISVTANFPYTFYFYLTLTGTSIMEEVIANVQYYKDGGLTNCPKVTLPTYQYTYNSQGTLQLLPDPYLYCIGTYYQIYKANWTVVDSISGANMNSVLYYGNQTTYRYANLTPSTVSNVQSGTILNVTVVFNTTQSTTNIGGYLSNATSQITFSQTPIVVSIIAYDQNKTVLPNNQVSYTEELLILNASTSYDPNNVTSNLIYTWTCPSILTSLYFCQSLQKGTYNQYLYLNAMQRVKIGFQFNTQYNFTVTASSVNNPYKTPVSQTISIYFNEPTKTDAKTNYAMAASCDAVNASGGMLSYFNSSYTKTVRYDKTNYTNSIIYIQTSTTSTSCKYGNANDQVMFIYFFDGIYNSTQSPAFIFQQSLVSGALKTSTNTTLNLTIPANLLSANYTYMYQANIYWFTQRDSSSDAVYLSIDTIYVYRQRAQLVASIANPKQTIDKFDNLILNASTSYDPENLNANISYKWTCPGTISTCANQTTSILTVNYKDRYLGNANTNGTNYTYSVIMMDSTRNSSSAYAYVSIYQQSSYAYCLSTTLNQTSLNSYSQTNNQTLYLQYNQSIPVTFGMTVTSYCSNVNVETSAYYPQSGSTFWTLDTSTSPSTVVLNQTTFMKYLTSTSISTILFKQTYSMGYGNDMNTKMTVTSFVNVNMTAPDVYAAIIGPRIAYFDTNSQQITLDGSSSYDPAGSIISFQWNCPIYFGGDGCSATSRLTLSYANLNANLNSLNDSLSNYYNQSHAFTLIVSSFDKTRVTTKQFYLYLSDSYGPFIQGGVSSCGIYLVNDTGATVLPFEQQNVFYFNCPSSPSMTSSLTNENAIQWSVGNLTQNVDYFFANNQLYLNAYIASKLSSQTSIVISATIDNVMINPLKWSFPIVYQQLNYNPNSISGQQYVLFNPNDQFFAYNETYNLTFTGFQSTRGYGLLGTARGWSNSYKSYQLVYPIQPLMNVTNTYFYQSLILTMSASLYFDFFDMNYNYMGSYNLQDQNFSSLELGYQDQDVWESILDPLCAKTSANYTNTTLGQYQYLYDVERVRKLQQGLSFGIVIYDGTSGRVATDYALSIITFYANTIVNMLAYYNPYQSSFVKSQRYQIERKCIYAISKMTQTGTNYTSLIGQVISILETIQKDYSSIVSEGSDQDIWTQQIIIIIQQTTIQLTSYISTNGNNTLAQSYALRLKVLSNWIIGGDFKGLSAGQSTSFIQYQNNKIALMIDPASTSSISFNSLINTDEQVSITSQAYLSSLGVANIEFSFTYSYNDSSPTSSLLNINTYDSNYSPITVTLDGNTSSVALQSTNKKKFSLFQQIFKQRDQMKANKQIQFFQEYTDADINQNKHLLKDDPTVYLSFALQATTTYQELFNSTLANDNLTYYLYPICVMYDTVNNAWTTNGLYNISTYDYASGLLNCATTQSGSFSLDYLSLDKVIINNGSSNDTNTTDSYFFDGYTLYYGLGVAIPSFITFLTIFATCICSQTWDAKNPRLEKLRTENPGCMAICKSVCLLHHLIISAICGPNKVNVHLTLPKYSKMVDMWWLFYAILAAVGLTLWQTPTVVWTEKLNLSFSSLNATIITNELHQYDHNMELSAFIIGVIVVGRIFVLTIGYTVYFMGKGPEMALKGSSTADIMVNSKFESDRGTDLEDNLIKKPKSKKGKKKKSRSKQLREENNFEMEGGSSDEEYKQKKSSKSKTRTGGSSKDKQIDSIPKKKKSVNRYGEVEKGSSSKQSNAKTDNSASSENKNLVDIIGEINEKTQQKRTAKRQINDSGIKASSGIQPASTQVLSNRNSNRRSESPSESLIKASSKVGDNQVESKRSRSKQQKLDEQEKPPSKMRSKNRNGVSKSPDKVEESKKRINKQDLFVDDNQYNKSRMNSNMTESSSMQETVKSSMKKNSGESTVYRPQKQYQDEMIKSTFTDETTKIKKKKKKTTRTSDTLSPAQDVGNYRINQSTKINSSIDSYYDLDSEVSQEKKSKRRQTQGAAVDEEYVLGQYKKAKCCTFVFKFIFLLGCMGITFWMMRWLVDLPHLYAWIAMSGLSFIILVLIIEPIFILIFTLFFKCTNGNGCCIRAAALVLLGNGHSNVINGVLYESNSV